MHVADAGFAGLLAAGGQRQEILHDHGSLLLVVCGLAPGPARSRGEGRGVLRRASSSAAVRTRAVARRQCAGGARARAALGDHRRASASRAAPPDARAGVATIAAGSTRAGDDVGRELERDGRAPRATPGRARSLSTVAQRLAALDGLADDRADDAVRVAVVEPAFDHDHLGEIGRLAVALERPAGHELGSKARPPHHAGHQRERRRSPCRGRAGPLRSAKMRLSTCADGVLPDVGHRGEPADLHAGHAANEGQRVRVLLLRHDHADARVAVGQLDEARTPGSPRSEVLGETVELTQERGDRPPSPRRADRPATWRRACWRSRPRSRAAPQPLAVERQAGAVDAADAARAHVGARGSRPRAARGRAAAGRRTTAGSARGSSGAPAAGTCSRASRCRRGARPGRARASTRSVMAAARPSRRVADRDAIGGGRGLAARRGPAESQPAADGVAPAHPGLAVAVDVAEHRVELDIADRQSRAARAGGRAGAAPRRSGRTPTSISMTTCARSARLAPATGSAQSSVSS